MRKRCNNFERKLNLRCSSSVTDMAMYSLSSTEHTMPVMYHRDLIIKACIQSSRIHIVDSTALAIIAEYQLFEKIEESWIHGFIL